MIFINGKFTINIFLELQFLIINQTNNSLYLFRCQNIFIQQPNSLYINILFIRNIIIKQALLSLKYNPRISHMQMMQSFLHLLGDTFFAKPTVSAIIAYLSYYTYICAGSILIPSKQVKGHLQPKRGPQLTYSINGFRLTILTIVLVVIFGGVIPELQGIRIFRVARLVEEFWPLWSVVNIFALIISILLYLKGKFGKSFLGQQVDLHSHGSFGLDFWVGRQLNPRLSTFDIKFVAYRVAMIFWLVLNLSFLALQCQRYSHPSLRMILYQLATNFYILDYFWNEEKMLTTWDIISEEFGYMLVFGDYVFIPFVFSVQCHYLLDYPDFDSAYQIIPIVILYLIGYYIFRVSNSQKNQFKRDPSQPIWGKKVQVVGGKLLVSGFWGLGRHMNYTGDLLMAIAYCLPCGCQIGGYTYAFYLFTLLTHRAYRDDTKCRSKYKLIWKQYTGRVPQVFIPIQFADILVRGIGRILYTMTNKEDLKQSEAKSS